MEITGNFLTQEGKNFPLDCETLDNLQRAIATVEMFGNLFGDKIILSGCTKQMDGTYEEGYVFIKSTTCPNGEVIPFKGGDTSEGVKIVSEDISVTTSTTIFASAYTSRYLAPANGNETGDVYMWDEFANVTPLRDFINNTQAKIKELETTANEHIGVVKMWAGSVDQIPEDYLLCDGRKLNGNRRDSPYLKLKKVLGVTLDDNGDFTIPDLRGKFVLGCNIEDTDCSTIGKTGGVKSFKLKMSNIPIHDHSYIYTGPKAYAAAQISTTGDFASVIKSVSNVNTYTGHSGQADPEPIELLPPYYVLAFIIKAK